MISTAHNRGTLTASEFLQHLYANCDADKWLPLCRGTGRPGEFTPEHWLQVRDLESADEYARHSVDQARFAYYSGGLQDRQLSGRQRGGAKQITVCTALAVDFDYDTKPLKPGQRAQKQYPSKAAVQEQLELIREQDFPAGLQLDTAHGLHAYWLFDTPLLMLTEADRNRASELRLGWIEMFERRLGCKLDHVHSVCHVMRLPGSHLTSPARGSAERRGPGDYRGFLHPRRSLVGVKCWGNDAAVRAAGDGQPVRSGPSDYSAPPGAPATNGRVGPSPWSQDLQARLDNLLTLPAFAAVWEERVKRFASPSEYDLSLAVHTRNAGWPTDEIKALIVRWNRERHPKRLEKVLRPPGGNGKDYLDLTLDRAFRDRANAGGPTRPSGNRTSQGNPSRPSVDVGEQDEARFVPEAWGALAETNEPPELFLFGGAPARIITKEDKAVVEVLAVDGLHYELTRRARCVKRIARTRQLVDAKPTERQLRCMLKEPRIPLPRLRRIVAAPVFAANGTLQVEPGYHFASETWYAPAPGFAVPPVSPNPTAQEIAAARQLVLDELLVDFPFADRGADLANAVALFLLPFARGLIDGPTPLHLIDKPVHGTGATLLAQMLLYPAIGCMADVLTQGDTKAEWRKRITAALLEAPEYILFDNLHDTLDSDALASACTASKWSDRTLGKLTMERVAANCIWILTGNNVTASSESADRIVRIRLDSKMERPRDRTGFKHELPQWAIEQRRQLVRAALTLTQAWIAAGKPYGSATLGSFQNWARVMGGILSVVGIEGFLTNRGQFLEAANPDDEWNERFVWELANLPRSEREGLTVREMIHDHRESFGALLDDVGSEASQGRQVKFGQRIRNLADRVFAIERDGKRVKVAVKRSGTRQRAAVWKIIAV